VASGVYAATGNVISFGRDSSGPTAASGVGEGVVQANLTSTVSGDAATKIYFAGGSQAFGTNPILTATGAAGVSGGVLYYTNTGAVTMKVFAKGAANDTSTSGGVYISDADSTAGKAGYLVVEICYIQPDDAPAYDDIEDYLPNRTVS
jgi:hypothetical protein